jgi:hypothetical protein
MRALLNVCKSHVSTQNNSHAISQRGYEAYFRFSICSEIVQNILAGLYLFLDSRLINDKLVFWKLLYCCGLRICFELQSRDCGFSMMNSSKLWGRYLISAIYPKDYEGDTED